jgi:hypothetical protein
MANILGDPPPVGRARPDLTVRIVIVGAPSFAVQTTPAPDRRAAAASAPLPAAGATAGTAAGATAGTSAGSGPTTPLPAVARTPTGAVVLYDAHGRVLAAAASEVRPAVRSSVDRYHGVQALLLELAAEPWAEGRSAGLLPTPAYDPDTLTFHVIAR